MRPAIIDTINLIKREYCGSRKPWIIGFSGGKDSSAVVKLVYSALADLKYLENPVTVLYVDTGVEIPIVASLVRKTVSALARESSIMGLPIRVRIAQPRLHDRYFVKVLGRGYPPPTNKFRWCTDRLRISPVQRAIKKSAPGPHTVVLGVRRGESEQRDRTLRRHGASAHHLKQSGNRDAIIFTPIIDYTLADVWDTVHTLVLPKAIQTQTLSALYRDASGECPIVRDPVGPPCGKGRFGCWTCSVVRRDRSVSALMSKGSDFLWPLAAWRSLLLETRDDPTMRCRRRRNGAPGPGPLPLRARKRLLTSLLRVQRQVPWTLIRRDELSAIRAYWKSDRESLNYSE